jgi:8-oxo-dGTP diphosphatase
VIYVTRGIILQGGNILAAQRTAEMSLPLKWELPGGKLEADEAPEDALVREIMEELGVVASAMEPLPFVDRAFKGKHFRMLPYICQLIAGTPKALEHAEVRWHPLDRLFELDWAPGEEILLGKWVEMEYLRANSRPVSSPAS